MTGSSYLELQWCNWDDEKACCFLYHGFQMESNHNSLLCWTPCQLLSVVVRLMTRLCSGVIDETPFCSMQQLLYEFLTLRR